MTAQDLIESSMRVLGVLASGESPTTDEVTDGLEALNMLLSEWNVNQQMIYAVSTNTDTLVSGTADVYIGDSGDICGDRPTSIQNVTITENGVSYPVKEYPFAQYAELGVKGTTGRPYRFYYNPEYEDGKLFLYPTPDKAYDISVDTLVPIDTFALSTTVIKLPKEYEAALKWNLAIDLSPEFGVTPSPVVIKKATDTKDSIINLNVSKHVKPVRSELAGSSRRFNINRGY